MATDRDAAAESLEDWEPVHFPTKKPTFSSSAAPNDWETIADVQRNDSAATSAYVFPPVNHEIPAPGLNRPSPNNQEMLQIDQPSPSLFLPPAEDGSGNEGGGSEIGGDADSGERSSDAPGGGNRFGILKSGIARVAETVRRCSVGRRSSGLWSCMVVAAAVLMYVKLVRWRRWVREETANHFSLLIREKDEKIRRLMIQIARLNEMLTARRRVHVVRVPHYYRNAAT